MNSPGLRDNYTRGTVAEFLTEKIQNCSKLSVVSAYFTIYAYGALKETLDQIDHLDFLFGEPSFVSRLDPSKTEKKSFIINGDGLELANRLQQKRVAKDCANWLERKVDIKTIRQASLLHGKMYHVATGGVEDAILGSLRHTYASLAVQDGVDLRVVSRQLGHSSIAITNDIYAHLAPDATREAAVAWEAILNAPTRNPGATSATGPS